MDAERRSEVDVSRRIDVPWRRCNRSIDGWMLSREEGVDCGDCCVTSADDPSFLFVAKSIG